MPETVSDWSTMVTALPAPAYTPHPALSLNALFSMVAEPSVSSWKPWLRLFHSVVPVTTSVVPHS